MATILEYPLALLNTVSVSQWKKIDRYSITYQSWRNMQIKQYARYLIIWNKIVTMQHQDNTDIIRIILVWLGEGVVLLTFLYPHRTFSIFNSNTSYKPSRILVEPCAVNRKGYPKRGSRIATSFRIYCIISIQISASQTTYSVRNHGSQSAEPTV